MHFPLTTITLRPEHCDPFFLLKELGANQIYCALLESADRQGTNDYSFLALGAKDILTIQNGKIVSSKFIEHEQVEDALSVFDKIISPEAQEGRLKMGYIGFLSFEATRQFERINLETNPNIPDACFVLPEILLKIDHNSKEITIVHHQDTTEDIAAIERAIHSSPFYDDRKTKDTMASLKIPLPTLEEIEPYRQTSREQYCKAVKAIQEDIAAGEAFQIVLSQELRLPAIASPEAVYEKLRILNPSPYMYYFRTPERVIVGASPETLVRVENHNILYRPIAGTRKRTGDEDQDRRMREELLSDQKERCEHQMLVDLGRNDVGRVAEIGSVRVENPFHIEQYAHVYHIVTDIRARVDSEKSSLDVVRSVFPAGTLSGAPKLRAMEIARREEKSPRGIYGGAFGYIDLSGNLDFAITIRTMLFQDNCVSLQVGAGIVRDSIPEREDEECLHKARSCLAALKLATDSLLPS